MTRRLILLAAASVIGLALLTGCQPEPSPSPTPTGFADEDAAFAAAEATYRAYVEALNQVDLSDPATFEEVYKWTTGDLNASDRESYSTWHAEGYTITGDALVRSVDAHAESGGAGVVLSVCYDVSSVNVIDPGGQSLVSPDRPPIQSLDVSLERDDTRPNGYLVAAISPNAGGPQCGT